MATFRAEPLTSGKFSRRLAAVNKVLRRKVTYMTYNVFGMTFNRTLLNSIFQHAMNLVRGAGTAGAAGAAAPAALVLRGRTGAEKCPFLQDNS